LLGEQGLQGLQAIQDMLEFLGIQDFAPAVSQHNHAAEVWPAEVVEVPA
jgi:hypothetical protein